MNKLTFIFIFTFISAHLFSQQCDFVWAKSISGSAEETLFSSVTDSNGNVYITGSFNGTVDFDPGIGIFNLTTPANNNDIFIAKYNSTGGFTWAKQLIGSGMADYGLSIDLDALGNVYTTGYFSAIVDFDPSTIGTSQISVNGFPHTFLLKLNASGNFVWAKCVQTTVEGTGGKVKINNGSIYLTGKHKGNSDFDLGSGTSNLTSTGTNPDMFLAKYDLDSNLIWAKKYGSAGYSENAWDINFDSVGNIYTAGVIGNFTTTPGIDQLDGTTSVPVYGNDDALIIKHDPDGNILWAKTFGSTYYDYAKKVIIDQNDTVYLSGVFYYTVDFDPGPSTYNLSSSGASDMFFLKLTSAGDFVLAKNIGGSNYDSGSVSKIINNNLLTVGYYRGAVDFDTSTNDQILTAVGGTDIFLLKTDLDFNYISVVGIGGTDDESGDVLYDNNNLYITGNYKSTVDFDPTSATSNLTAAGGNDMFILKLQDTNLENEEFNFKNLNIYPNPFKSTLSIDIDMNAKIEVCDFLGKIIETKNIHIGNTQLDLNNYTSGLYLLKVTYENNQRKIVKIVKQ